MRTKRQPGNPFCQNVFVKNGEKRDEKRNGLSVFGLAVLFFCPALGRISLDEKRNNLSVMVTTEPD